MKAILNSKNGIFIVLLILCFFSCSSKKNNAGYYEGSVEYKVNMDEFNSPVSYLCPESFDLLYSKKGFVLKSSFMMGLMEFKMFHDYSSDIVNMLMGVSGNGKYSTCDMRKLVGNINKTNIRKVNCAINILGYNCKCIEYKNSLYNTLVRLYYSDSFSSQMSSAIFPETEIEGMILKVEVENNDGKINIVAQKFSDEKIPTSLFDIPETYSKTSLDEITDIIRDMSK